MVEHLGLSFRVFTAKSLGVKIFEPRCEKICLRGFRPGPTQTRLYSYRR